MIWDQMTSPEIGALSRQQLILLPVSATEQHGDHLPLATDRMIGEHFCNELEKHRSPKILILPSLGIGCSEHHLDFSGTLSLSHQTFWNQMEEVLHSVKTHDFRKLLVFNSHGGNQGIGQVMVEHFGRRHPEVLLVFATWWKLALESLHTLNESGPGGAGHAGEFETSLMLHIAPQLVRREKITRGANQKTFDWAEGDLLSGPQASLFRSMKEMTPNGVFGDPTYASAEKGKAITKVVMSALLRLVDELYDHKI